MMFSKQIDHTPDITSDAYWDTHEIALVRIANIQERAGRSQITHQLEESFNAAPPAATVTAPLHHYWFGQAVVAPPALAVRDYMVVINDKTAPGPIVTYKLQQPPASSALVHTLRQIRKLRAGPSSQALREAASGSDDTLAIYALKRLLARPADPALRPAAAPLRQLSNDPNRGALRRILSREVASVIEGQSPDSETEYDWVSNALMSAHDTDWQHLRPFVERLLQFPEQRAKTVALLTGFARSPRRTHALRIASYSAFDDPRLFHFERPDDLSDKIFATAIAMLGDRNELIRRAAAALVHNLASRINRPLRQPYAERGRAAIEESSRTEKNEGVSRHFEAYLAQLKRTAEH